MRLTSFNAKCDAPAAIKIGPSKGHDVFQDDIRPGNMYSSPDNPVNSATVPAYIPAETPTTTAPCKGFASWLIPEGDGKRQPSSPTP